MAEEEEVEDGATRTGTNVAPQIPLVNMKIKVS